MTTNNNEDFYAVADAKLVKSIDVLVRDGVITINEARQMLGLAPLETDYRLQSLNYVDAEIASRYQMLKAGTMSKGGAADGE